MKYSIALAAVVATLAAAQSLGDLSPCGQGCINGMLGQAESLGCTAQDQKCLCGNEKFGFGVRDCANEACGSDAPAVIAFGVSYCSSILAAAPASSGLSVLSSASSAASASASDAGASASSAASGVSASASSLASGANASASSAANSASSAAGSAASSASGAVSSAGSSAASRASSATDAAGSAASSAAGSATSSEGGAPVMTAAPILAGGALAALLMI